MEERGKKMEGEGVNWWNECVDEWVGEEVEGGRYGWLWCYGWR